MNCSICNVKLDGDDMDTDNALWLRFEGEKIFLICKKCYIKAKVIDEL